MKAAYTNYRDGSDVPAPLTDETALLILPELGGHGIFKILRSQGASIEEGVLCVLHASVGETDKANKIMVKYNLPELKGMG